MPRLHLLLAITLLALGTHAGTRLLADDNPVRRKPKPNKGPAFTEPPQNDPSFQLMGEFVGEITASGGQSETLGLQIRPVGRTDFDAVSFVGGLPGQDKFNPKPVRMIGRRNGDLVVLSGGPWAIFVEPEGCLLVDREGNKLGRLARINRVSPTLGARPPKDAMVLFDGKNTDQFTKAQMTKDGLLMQGADVKPMFQDFNLHVEFRLPYMPQADGQSRGNSGLYLQSRYECQVLDSFALEPLINGLGALYQFRAPELNMSFPPLVWQTYDVQFTAPRWAADGSKIRDAHVTTWVNGVKVQDNVALPDKTGHGSQEEPVLMPIRLQDHGDPVRFRNIWVVDRGLAMGEFPIRPTKEELEAAAKAEAEKKKREADAAKKAAEEKMKAEQAKKATEEKNKAEGEKAAAAKKPVEPGKQQPAKPTMQEQPQEAKPEPKPESKPEPKPEPEPEPKPAQDQDSKPESKPQPKTQQPKPASTDKPAESNTPGAEKSPQPDPKQPD